MHAKFDHNAQNSNACVEGISARERVPVSLDTGERENVGVFLQQI